MLALGRLFFVKEENSRIKSQYSLFASSFKFGTSRQIFMKFSVKVRPTKAPINPPFFLTLCSGSTQHNGSTNSYTQVKANEIFKFPGKY